MQREVPKAMSQRTSKAARTAEAAVDRLERLYAEAAAGLSSALDRYLSTGEPPSAATRATFRYPLLRVVHRDLDRPAPTHRRAFGRLQRLGVYETTVTHPRAFRRYLLEQLNPLLTSAAASCNAIWISASAEIGISGGTSASRMRSFQGGFPPFTQSAE
jgi:AMP nucleosidase